MHCLRSFTDIVKIKPSCIEKNINVFNIIIYYCFGFFLGGGVVVNLLLYRIEYIVNSCILDNVFLKQYFLHWTKLTQYERGISI